MSTREIKFRAWLDNEMCEFELGDALVNNAGGIVEFSKVPIMQYTGLKDKNGKEIYEGDIIAMLVKRGNKVAHESKVKWGSDGWVLETIHPRDFNGKPETLTYPIISPFTDMGEIIGNIYENPELLTEKSA